MAAVISMAPAIFEASLRSLGIAACVSLIAGALGVAMAWLVSRTDLPGGRVLSGLLSVPYAIPAYLIGMAWIVLGNPTVGLLRAWLPASGSYGFWGITLVEATVAFAFPFLELKAGFERMDPALEEAARMSGAGPWRVFRDVSFPLLRPALMGGMKLAFLYALASFGVPALLGMPVRQLTLTTLIYSQLKLGGVEGLKAGFGLSLWLLALAGLSMLAFGRLARFGTSRRGARPGSGGADSGGVATDRDAALAIAGGKSSRRSQVRLGARARVAAFAGAWGLFALAVVLPWCALGMSALAPTAGKYSVSLWTVSHLKYVWGLADFREALANSLALAITVAALVVGGGFGLGFLAVRRKRGWARRVIDALGVPFATPGTILAMGVLFAAVVSARFGVPINEPLFMMGVAYGLKYAAVGARGLAVAYGQVDPVMEEAARVSGADTRELLWTIWVPLLRKSLGAAFFLALLSMLTELTMSVLLTGPGAATLGTVLFDLQEYADQPSAAALAWGLMTVALGVGLATQLRKERTS